MKKLYLHIGMEKNGTTSIQGSCVKNMDNLIREGYLYPNLNNSINGNHLSLSVYASDDDNDFYIKQMLNIRNSKECNDFRLRFRKDFDEKIKKFEGHSVILSGEHCSSVLNREDEIIRLREFLGNYFSEVKIIVYIREQVQTLASQYSTYIICGGTDKFKSPIDFKNELYFNYNLILKNWENVFGKENIILRIFDKKEFLNGNLIDDFFNIVGVTFFDRMDINLNKSLNLKQAEILRQVNKVFPNFSKVKLHSKIKNKIKKELGSEFLESPEIKDLITLEYLNKYLECNEEVRKRYFKDREYLFEKFKISKNVIKDQEDVLSSDDLKFALNKIMKVILDEI